MGEPPAKPPEPAAIQDQIARTSAKIISLSERLARPDETVTRKTGATAAKQLQLAKSLNGDLSKALTEVSRFMEIHGAAVVAATQRGAENAAAIDHAAGASEQLIRRIVALERHAARSRRLFLALLIAMLLCLGTSIWTLRSVLALERATAQQDHAVAKPPG